MKITPIDQNSLREIRLKIRQKMASLKGHKLIVVGDLGLDQYVHGDVRRISPEAPVPVLEVTEENRRLGLATNVAQNVASLGGEPLLVGVVGCDETSEILRGLLTEAQVSHEHLLSDPQRPTTRKLRVMSGQHHLVRVDYEHKRYLTPMVEEQLLQKVRELLPIADGIIMEDYAKGVISRSCARQLVNMCQEHSLPLMIDPNRLTPPEFYQGATLLTPNREEAFQLAGVEMGGFSMEEKDLLVVGERLVSKLNLKHLVLTQGSQGMTLFSEGEVWHLPTYARQVFDVTGAGYTVIAALSLAWVSGFNLKEACVLGNYAAGVVVGKVGCVPCHWQELLEFLSELE